VDIALVRELVDASVRPGQPGGSLAVSRAPLVPLLTVSRPVAANRYDWAGGSSIQGALYGRGRYGSDRYLQAG